MQTGNKQRLYFRLYFDQPTQIQWLSVAEDVHERLLVLPGCSLPATNMQQIVSILILSSPLWVAYLVL